MEAGVTIARSAVHGHRDDLDVGMEAGVTVAPSSAPVSPRTATAYEQIDAMYEDAHLYDTVFANNDDIVPFWEDDRGARGGKSLDQKLD